MNHYRPVKAAGNDCLLVAAEVVAKLGGVAVLLEHADSFLVGNPRKGRFDVFELLDVALQDFKFARLVFHHTLDDGADQSFAEVHHVGEFGVSGFRLQHPEFGQVPAGFGFFRAEGRTEGVNLAEGHGRGFDVKLAALRQVGLLIVDVVHFEERAGALTSRGCEHRCVGERVTLGVHEVSGGSDGFGTDAENRCLARSSDPQVALVEQEIDAVLFELDGEGCGFRNALDDLDFGDAHFVPAGSALLGANLSRYNDAGLLREPLKRFESLRIFFERADALNDASAVPKDREDQLAGFANVVEPAADGDFLAVVFPCVFNGDRGHGGLL